MKVLLVRGNPRKDGVSERLADLFVRGLKRGGAEVADVDITRINVEECRGCFACSMGEKGRCVIGDDMEGVLKVFDEADALVCVSPIYFYAMSAQLKKFFDRCFPFVRGYFFDSECDCMRNNTNFAKKNKKFVTLGAASGRMRNSFEAATHTYRVIARSLGFDYVADIRRAESPHFASIDAKSYRVRKILDAYELAGVEFGKRGEISPETVATAELELAESDAAFAQNARIFWELHKLKGVAGFNAADLKTDVRILLREMCRLLIPEEAPERADIQFAFPDKNWVFTMRIKDGKCALDEGSAESPCDLRITCSSHLWADIMGKRANVMEQISCGALKLDGNARLFSSMKKYFSFPDII